MNVYKVIDPYSKNIGEMALVAANNEEEAIIITKNNSKCHYLLRENLKAIILTDIISKINKPYLITQSWYYEKY